jgi:hypothetical protein
MRCPDCGTENPDNSWFCGECGKTLGDMSAHVRGATAIGSRNSVLEPGPHITQSAMVGSPLMMAWTALMVGLVLLVANVILRVYYYEGIMLSYSHYSDYQRLGSWMTYTSAFGYLAVVLGMMFVVTALIRHRSRTDILARIPLSRLSTVKWILIIAAIILAAAAVSAVVSWESGFDLGGNITARLNMYAYGIAWLVVTAALFVFVLGLRDAERSS